MPQNVDLYRIFIASPGGLEVERARIAELCQQYARQESVRRGVLFQHVGWEEVVGDFLIRPQEAINERLSECDFFVLLLHDPWGSPPGGDSGYTSGTQEEWEMARALIADSDAPMRQLAVFFKAVDPMKMADPGPKLQPVLDFRMQLEKDRELLYQTYDSTDRFSDLFRQYLSHWMQDIELAAGATSPRDLRPAPPPEPAKEVVVTAREAHEPIIRSLLETAEALADKGQLTEAEQIFGQAVKMGGPDAPNRLGHFLRRLGRLDQAEESYRAAMGRAPGNKLWEAIGSGNLSLLCMARGDLEQAETLNRKGLEIDTELGNREGVARHTGNLGILYMARGDLDRAEEMHRQSLEIAEELGLGETLANQYGNLGLVYQERGDLDQAEAMYRKSLAVSEELGLGETLANQYDNLGNLFKARGDSPKARSAYEKALQLFEQIGARGDGWENTRIHLALLETQDPSQSS